MKIDTKTYINPFLNQNIFNKYNNKKEEVFKLLSTAKMNGWLNPDLSYLDKIFELKDKVVKQSDCLVVIAIGGSFLGSCAINSIFTPYFKDNSFKIIYASTTISSNYMSQLLEYLETVSFSVNVISKSGTTLESSIVFSLIKNLMKKKYSLDEMKDRIIITTDQKQGDLRKEVLNYGYESFEIPENIGGRYSLITPAHLFPLAFNIDIKQLIAGYKEGLTLLDDAFSYALVRRSLFDQGKFIENFISYENNFYYYMEFLKQLFGETEGKNGKGIFPTSMIHTRDLHSLGQFIQDGNKIVFETFFKVLKTNDLNFNDKTLNQANLIIEDSVIAAHVKGNVPCIVLEVSEITPYTIGKISSFFFLVAAFSGFLFDVDPFNQPGVEVYKNEVRLRL